MIISDTICSNQYKLLFAYKYIYKTEQKKKFKYDPPQKFA